MHTAASFLIRSFAYQEIQPMQINKLLPKVLVQVDTSPTSASKHTKKYLVFFNKRQSSSFSLAPPNKETKKKKLAEIYNSSLAGALKNSNIKNVKLAKKKVIKLKKLICLKKSSGFFFLILNTNLQ
jgi:hypothetical protein